MPMENGIWIKKTEDFIAADFLVKWDVVQSCAVLSAHHFDYGTG
jgi:hypothetical protein